MKALLALAGLALAASPAEARTMRCAPVSRAAVESQFAKFNNALLSRDPGKVAALFAPDAVLLPTLSDEMRTTPAGIRDYFVHFLEKIA
jgi:hypothetical protein